MTPDHPLIRLYLDEDVSVIVGEYLRARGFDVLTTRDASRLGQSDASQLAFATNERRAILTHNRCDFESLHRTALTEQRSHAGIIIANRRASSSELAKRVLKLLNLLTAEEMANQLLYI
ncbi:MAG: DUF5615 family PIN-like protein [Nitrospirota bacterium]